MKQRLPIALGALVLAVATIVHGDYNVLNKGTYYQNATNGAKVSVAGDAVVEQSNAPQTFTVFVPSWMNVQLRHRLNGGPPPGVGEFMQDSTTAVDVRGCTGLALMIYPTFKDSTSAQLLGLQVRWHYSETVDSQSTFIEQATRVFPAAASATARDSIGSLFYGDAATPYQIGKYGGEEADSVATPDEQVLVLTNSVGQNRGRFVRISPPNSSNYSAGPFMSIRLRHLNSQYWNGAWMGDKTSGAGGIQGEQAVRIRVDLVGWR